MSRDRFRAARRDIVGAMRRASLVALAGLCACPPPSSLLPDALTSASPDSSGSSENDSSGAGPQNPRGYLPMLWTFALLSLSGFVFAALLRRRETGPEGHGLESRRLAQAS